MPKATVAIEDRRFYEHGGLDVEGIARAVWKNVNAGEVVEGGSTITQQLVRNLYIGRERTVERKLKEACLAIKLNDAWSKSRILATYMNQVYYGNLAYGIEAAAQTYYSKNAAELNLPQAALLAGLPQLPSAYDPFNRPEIATVRRNRVLEAMLNEGYIKRDGVRWAVKRGLGLKAGKLYTTIREPYFFSYVRDELIEEYGAAAVRSGGLKVYTTIDPRFQRAARKAIKETLYDRDDPAAAVISINPANGAIRAMTAVTPGDKKSEFNLLSQARRQSGSTFKTFVLTAAVAQGINPATSTYLSAPFYYRPDPNGNCEDGSWWCPETYDHSYTGWTSIERATLRSDNTVYAQLTLDVTPEAVAKMAEKLGVRSRLDVGGAYVPSIGLGAMDVSPLDMASAYATLAAGGVYSEPMAIRKVDSPDGEDTRAGWGKPKRKRVISDGVASRSPRSSRRTSTTARAPAPTTGSPPPARPERPRSGPTPGSAVTPRARNHRLGRVSEGQDPDEERARDPRHRRQLPGADLAPLHELRDRPTGAGGVPGAEGGARVEGVRARAIRALVRLLPGSERDARDDHGGDDDGAEATPSAGPGKGKKKNKPVPLAPAASSHRRTSPTRRRRRPRPSRRPEPSDRLPSRAALAAAGMIALLVGGCVACAWVERAPIVPADAGRAAAAGWESSS